ncbi:Protein DGS1 mitochondrial [Bienertia sinuspersici]
MLELNQILKANEINFAILAALPAFVLAVLSLMLMRSWIVQVRMCIGPRRDRDELDQQTKFGIFIDRGLSIPVLD